MSDFAINDDRAATWAAQKIKEKQDELERLVAWYTAQIDAAQKQVQDEIAFLTDRLQEYFRTVPHRATKTGIQKYAFPGGEMILTPAKQSFSHDDATLLAWCKEHDRADLINITEKPRWAEIKAMIKATGELPDGVEPIEEPEKFSVKVV